MNDWIRDTICIVVLSISMSPGRIHQNERSIGQTTLGLGAIHDNHRSQDSSRP